MALAAPKFEAFFSYCRDDSSFVVRLAADLKEAGAKVWLDQLDIAPGQRWDRAIEEALMSCPSLIVILSPTSIESTNVMDEVSFALEEKKTVIPVVYKDCVIPFRLRRLQYVDFKQDYDYGFQQLLGALTPVQKTEHIASTSSQVRTDIPETKKPFSEAEQAHLAEKRRKVVEQARLEVERTPPAPAQESRRDFFSRLPAAAKGGAGALTILIVAFLLYWKFLPSPSNKQSGQNQKQSPQFETTNPPPVVSQQRRETPAPTPTPVAPQQNGSSTSPKQTSPARVETSTSSNSANVSSLSRAKTRSVPDDGSLRPGNVREMKPDQDTKALVIKGESYYKAGQYKEALPFFRKAAEGGNSAAAAYLGRIYEKGLGGVPKDELQALSWYRKGADAGDARGMSGLGVMYAKGLGGLPKNEMQAVSWYRKAADAGNSYGMFHLGFMYENGHGGLPKDDTQAVSWYRKAADAGDAYGMFRLGLMYENGRGGLPKDDVQAVNWYRKAAALGNEKAQEALRRLGR